MNDSRCRSGLGESDNVSGGAIGSIRSRIELLSASQGGCHLFAVAGRFRIEHMKIGDCMDNSYRKTVCSLDDPGITIDAVGGKAINLARMTKDGFRVPPAFVVTVSAYDSFMACTGLGERIAAELSGIDFGDEGSLSDGTGRIRGMISGEPMPESLSEEISSFLEADGERYYAVRSSAVAEDLPDASFAGQQDTFLFIRPADVPKAVAMCWASYWNERAVKYRHDAGIDHLSTGMAVVIQRMVSSDTSGVMFTVNPVDGSDDVVVESAWGLGESIASGLITPDRFVVGRDGTVRERNIRHKEKGFFLSEGRNTLRDIERSRMDAPSSDDGLLREVLDLGLRLERNFGAPQDVEWAVEGGVLYVLQSRNITTVADASELDGILWTRGYGDEYWADATSPMFFDVMGKMLTKYVNHEGAKMMGYRDLTSGELIKLYKSRAYFNAHTLERVFSYYPRFVRSKELLSYFPAEDQERISQYPAHMGKAVWSQIRVFFLDHDGSIFTTDKAYRRWAASFMDVCRGFDATDLAGLSDRELADLYRKVEEASVKHYQLIRYGMVSHSIATNLMVKNWLKKWIGDEDGACYAGLISGLENNKTVETNIGFSEMAKTVRADPELKERIDSMASEEFAEWLESRDIPLREQFFGFLDAYGHRSNTREIYYPRWMENKAYVVDVVRLLAQSDSDLKALEARRREERLVMEKEVRRRIRRSGVTGVFRCGIYGVVLRLAQKYLTFRENQRFYLDHILFRERLAILEMGRRLSGRGVIPSPEDVFFLFEQEAWDALLSGSSEPAKDVGARRSEFFKYANILPPKFLRDGIDFDDAVDYGSSESVKGTASSPGVVKGKVRVVGSIEGLSELEEGDILVTSNTDPGWTAAFSKLGGLITETGGILSHGAVISREYRIPAVTAVMGATKIFRTGQTVTVDGNDGTIYLEEEE